MTKAGMKQCLEFLLLQQMTLDVIRTREECGLPFSSSIISFYHLQKDTLYKEMMI